MLAGLRGLGLRLAIDDFGAETAEQTEGLARVGVRLVQGYFYAPAVPVSAWPGVVATPAPSGGGREALSA